MKRPDEFYDVKFPNTKFTLAYCAVLFFGSITTLCWGMGRALHWW